MLAYGKIDYEALLSADGSGADLAAALARDLSRQGIRVDTRWTYLIWLVPIYLWSIPSVIFFLPLGVWVIWLGGSYFRHRWRTSARASTHTTSAA